MPFCKQTKFLNITVLFSFHPVAIIYLQLPLRVILLFLMLVLKWLRGQVNILIQQQFVELCGILQVR